MVKQTAQFPADFLPKSVIDESQYEREKKNNERIFKETVKRVRPDLYVLMDLLDETGINFFVIVKIIHALNNVVMGGGWADVRIEIRNGRVLFVRGEEQMKLDEPLVIKTTPT